MDELRDLQEKTKEYGERWRHFSWLNARGRAKYNLLNHKTKLWQKRFWMDLQHHAYLHTYFVKTTGNDGLDGLSDATAWRTIAKVQATVVSGDLVQFRSQDTWSIGGGESGFVAKAGVTYDGEAYGDGDRAKLNMTSTTSLGPIIEMNYSNSWVIGFELDGNDLAASGIFCSYYHAVTISNLNIDNCWVHNFATLQPLGHGIMCTSQYGNRGVEDVTITDCIVHDCDNVGIAVYPGWQASGNYFNRVTIRGCESYNNGIDGNQGGNESGLMIKDDVRNLTVEFNYFHDNMTQGIQFDTAGGIPQWTNCVLRYNLLKHNKRWGIYLNNGAATNRG